MTASTMSETTKRIELPMALVVDDDDAIREALADVLRDERYLVATAADGACALDLLRGGLRPSVILLDLWLPRVDGRDVLCAIRADDDVKGTPVIVISADDNARHDSTIAAHADAVLSKPVDLHALLTHVWRVARP